MLTRILQLVLLCVVVVLAVYGTGQVFDEQRDPYTRFTKFILSIVGLAACVIAAIALSR